MPHSDKQPKSWKEMSFDMRFFFKFHVCMMGLMMAHFALGAGIVFEIAVVGCAALAGLVLSIRNRRKHGWHWSGANWKNVLGALLAAVLILYFLGAALPGTTIFNPNLFPWLAAGGGILVFGVLSALNVVQQSEEEFLRHCGEGRPVESPPPPSGPQLPGWKRVIAGAFGIYFLAVWIVAVGFFWKFNSAYSHGSQQPTTAQTEKLSNHGHTVYITPEEKQMVDLLKLALMPGIPSIFVMGAILHFVVGVKVFSKDRS